MFAFLIQVVPPPVPPPPPPGLTLSLEIPLFITAMALGALICLNKAKTA